MVFRLKGGYLVFDLLETIEILGLLIWFLLFLTFLYRGKDKVTVLVESYRFYGIKLPFLFHKVTVFGPKLPFFVGSKLPFILGQSYRFWDKVTVILA